ncbi:MAG: peptidylprolyl isomerase [Ignavibacteriaceae bacterium]
MNWKKHLSRIKIVLTTLLTAALIAGCQESSDKTDYVARVNDSYLSGNDLLEILDSANVDDNFKAEVIRNWILKELLYQEAISEGILNKRDFKNILEKSKKELAGSILLKNFSSNVTLDYQPREVEEYYTLNKREFNFRSNSFKLNIATFSNQNNAVQFRFLLLSSGWDEALSQHSDDATLLSVSDGIILSEQDIYPQKLARIVNGLRPPEISIVISDDAGYHTVAQVLNNFKKGTIPPFDIIKESVEERFIADKKKQLLDNYIDELYSKSDIEIKY